MIHTERHLRALELDKILEQLAEQTACAEAARIARALTPSSDPDEVRRRLTQTDDAYVLAGRFGSPSFGGLLDCTNALRRAEAGGVLTMGEYGDKAIEWQVLDQQGSKRLLFVTDEIARKAYNDEFDIVSDSFFFHIFILLLKIAKTCGILSVYSKTTPTEVYILW